MEIVNKKIQELKPYEKNPRKNEKAIDYVAESIKQFGFKVPIVIDKNNVIIAGHTRYLACQKLGMKEVPCIVASDLSDEQVKAYRLADNKVSEYSEWDIDLLDSELAEIVDIDMSDFGFNFDDIEEEETEVTRKDLSENEFEKYEIIITCENELDLQTKYEKLQQEGYDCRISTL